MSAAAETPTPGSSTPEDAAKSTPKLDADGKERRRRDDVIASGEGTMSNDGDAAAGAAGSDASGAAGAGASAPSMSSSKDELNEESMTSFGMHSPDSPPGDEGESTSVSIT